MKTYRGEMKKKVDSKIIMSEPELQKGQKYRSRDKFGSNPISDWGGFKWTCPSGVSVDVKNKR